MCTYATTIIHGTAYTVLHIAIEMQIAFFFFFFSLCVVCVFLLIVVNQPRLKEKTRKGGECAFVVNEKSLKCLCVFLS